MALPGLALVLAMLGSWPLALSARELVDADQIARCARDNRPAQNILQTVELTSTDRLGNELVRRATVYSGNAPDRVRALYLQLIYPSDLSGSRLLLAEREGLTQVFVAIAGTLDLTRLNAAGGSSRLFGTDFSSEDLARLYGMNKPGHSQRLEDGQSEGRPTYVIETRPQETEDSTYALVVSHIDKDTCVVLRAELYERPEQLRKLLTAPPASVKQIGSVWIAHDLLMRDLLDQTQTRFLVERVESGDRVRDLPFRIPAPE